MDPHIRDMVLFRHPNTLGPVAYVGWVRNRAADSGGMYAHAHTNCLEISFIETGRLEWWAGTQPRYLNPNDALLTLPREPHGAVDDAIQPSSWFWIHIFPERIPAGLWQSFQQPRLARHRQVTESFARAFRQILEEHKVRNVHSEAMVHGLVNQLLVEFLRCDARPSRVAHSKWGVETLTRLGQKTDDKLSVHELAEKLDVSVAWLHKRFRKEFGEPPGRWMREERIVEAKRRLAETDEGISSISADLGYPSSQYFATVFKRETGLTPSDYRKRRVAAPTKASRQNLPG